MADKLQSLNMSLLDKNKIKDFVSEDGLTHRYVMEFLDNSKSILEKQKFDNYQYLGVFALRRETNEKKFDKNLPIEEDGSQLVPICMSSLINHPEVVAFSAYITRVMFDRFADVHLLASKENKDVPEIPYEDLKRTMSPFLLSRFVDMMEVDVTEVIKLLIRAYKDDLKLDSVEKDGVVTRGLLDFLIATFPDKLALIDDNQNKE